MIWDTGAHQTVITEDLLSDTFRQYLEDPIHDRLNYQSMPRYFLNAKGEDHEYVDGDGKIHCF